MRIAAAVPRRRDPGHPRRAFHLRSVPSISIRCDRHPRTFSASLERSPRRTYRRLAAISVEIPSNTGAMGPDCREVADFGGLTYDDVSKRPPKASVYRVFMLGSSRIRVSRSLIRRCRHRESDSARTRRTGSVAIAGADGGTIPSTSPGGLAVSSATRQTRNVSMLRSGRRRCSSPETRSVRAELHMRHGRHVTACVQASVVSAAAVDEHHRSREC
jgi:hypothetical protein